MSQTFQGSPQELIPSAPEGRFDGVSRPYTAEDVLRLRGSFPIAHTLASAAPSACGSSSMSVPMFIRSAP
jgi:isocitrate lyase